MFKQIFVKSVASTAAVGSLFAASLVAAPTMVATAPEIRTVACGDDYAAATPTTTELTLSRAAGMYGVYNKATATVTDSGEVPTGSVRFTIYNVTTGSATRGGTVELTGGSATLQLNRYLRANSTYIVTASYLPADDCQFQASDAEAQFYTVYKRKTSTSVDTPARRKAQRPLVSLSVRGRWFSENLGGKARVVITSKKSGKVVRATTVRVPGGSTKVSFKRLPPGLYTATVKYLGNRNYAASSGADGFRVRR